MFGGFPGRFLYFCWTLLWCEWKCGLYNIGGFKFVGVCFIAHMQCTSVNTAYAHKKNMSSVIVEWTVLYISVRSGWLILNDSWSTYLSIIERRDLELPTITNYLSVIIVYDPLQYESWYSVEYMWDYASDNDSRKQKVKIQVSSNCFSILFFYEENSYFL